MNDKKVIIALSELFDRLITVSDHPMYDGEVGTHRSFIRYFPNHDLSIIFLSYISYDFDKVKEEFEELLASLETIPDNEQKKEEALKIINKKYPAPRGYERVMNALDDLISNH